MITRNPRTLIVGVCLLLSGMVKPSADPLAIPGFEYRGSVSLSGSVESDAVVTSPAGDTYYVAAVDGALSVYACPAGGSEFVPYAVPFALGSPEGVRDVRAFNRFADEWMVFYIARDSFGNEGLFSLSCHPVSNALLPDGVRYDIPKGSDSSITRYLVERNVLREFHVFCIGLSHVSWTYVNGLFDKQITNQQSVAHQVNDNVDVIKISDGSYLITSVGFLGNNESMISVSILTAKGEVSSTSFIIPHAAPFRRCEKVWDFNKEYAISYFFKGATVLVGLFDEKWTTRLVPSDVAIVIPNGYPLKSFALLSNDGKLFDIPSDLSMYNDGVDIRFNFDQAYYIKHEYSDDTVIILLHSFMNDSSLDGLTENILSYDMQSHQWMQQSSVQDCTMYSTIRVFAGETDDLLIFKRKDDGLEYSWKSDVTKRNSITDSLDTCMDEVIVAFKKLTGCFFIKPMDHTIRRLVPLLHEDQILDSFYPILSLDQTVACLLQASHSVAGDSIINIYTIIN